MDINYESLSISNYCFPIKLWHGVYDLKNRGKILRDHFHEHIEIWTLRKGSVTYTVNDIPYDLKTGDTIVVNPNEIHSIIYNSEMVLYDCIILSPLFLTSGIDKDILEGHDYSENTLFKVPGVDKVLEYNNIKIINYIKDKKIIDIMDKIINICEHKEIAFEIEIREYISKLIVYLFRNYPNKDYDNFNVSNKIIPAINYINANFKENISYKYLSKITNFSEEYFCKLFKKTMNKTVVSYINELRIKESINLLLKSNLSITEIAYNIGFNDSNYFGRIFKKTVGCTPKEYRKNNKVKI